jgi:hypothetical protein
MSTGYDYTREEAMTADDFEISQVQAVKSADQIEAESSFEDIPPGVYELVIVGFLKPPKDERKEVYVDGQRVGYSTHSVVVKFARTDAPAQQVTDYFLLPPGDPEGLDAYQRGSKGPEGKAAGFNSNKFFHFIERLGFPTPAGGFLPPEACRLGNWRGRRVIATVIPGDPPKNRNDTKVNTDGDVVPDDRPVRPQIKLFSYRAADSTVNGPVAAPRKPGQPANGGPVRTAPTQPSPASVTRGPAGHIQPTRPAPQRQPVAAGNANRGLDNI